MDRFGINVIDIGASLVICLFTLRGFHRGLSGEIAQFIGLAAALALGLLSFHPFGSWIENHARLSSQPAHALAFVLTVLGMILVMVLLALLLRSIMKITFDPKIDKPGGGLAGLLGGMILVVIVFLIMNLWPHEYLNRQFGRESVIGRVVVKWMPTVQEKIEDLPATKDVKQGLREAQKL